MTNTTMYKLFVYFVICDPKRFPVLWEQPEYFFDLWHDWSAIGAHDSCVGIASIMTEEQQ